MFLRQLLEPLEGNFRVHRLLDEIEALEYVAEDAIEAVEIALVLHQGRAREVVEILDPPAGEVHLHRLHQREVFAQRHRNAGVL